MTHSDDKRFTVGEWTVEPDTGRVSREGESVSLRPRLMDLLVYLAERANTVVSNDDIIEGPWKGIIVADSSVYGAISDLRKALHDTTQPHTYIETIPKRGYRLIAPVENLGGQFLKIDEDRSQGASPYAQDSAGVARDPSSKALASRIPYIIAVSVFVVAFAIYIFGRFTSQPDVELDSSVMAPQASIAVLPFANMSEDPGEEYFSDGISEELLNALTKVGGLRVVARTSSFSFKDKDKDTDAREIGSFLNVATILEGSVRRSDTKLRISAQLIDVTTGYHIWSETYDREIDDIFAMQDEISQAIVDALHVHLGLEAPTLPKLHEADFEAYRLYLLGRHNLEQRTRDTLTRALDLFDRAIAIDPDYAPAYSGMADAYLFLDRYGDLSPTESVVSAKPLIERALELDPDLAEAHASKGLSFRESGQLGASLQAYDRAIELNPSLARAWHWKAISLAESGDYRGALEGYQHAHTLDPLSKVIFKLLILNKIRFGQFTEAEELLEGLRATSPRDTHRFDGADYWLQNMQGNWASAYALATSALEENQSRGSAFDLGIAQLTLRAFDSETTGFLDTTRIVVNSYDNPAVAWRDYQALPLAKRNRRALIENMAWGVAHLGKYKEVTELLENSSIYHERFPGLLFDFYFPRMVKAPLLVLARRQTGDEAGARRLMSITETYIDVMNEQGATWTLSFLEAEVHALKGEDDEVIAALEQADSDGYLTWFWLDIPLFDTVRDREDFQAIVRSVDARVNEERAKLGWEPVE